jgi:CCR4-NOT transcription complex subunit 7/8
VFNFVQFMMTAVEGMHGGLNTLADNLKVERLGPIHQAGSDSLLTSTTFFAFRKAHFGDTIDDSR